MVTSKGWSSHNYFGRIEYDVLCLLICTVGLAIVRRALELYCFKPIAESLIVEDNKDDDVDLKQQQKKQAKLAESMWKVIGYGVATFLEIRACFGTSWMKDLRLCWSECQYDDDYSTPCQAETSSELYSLYLYSTSFYLMSVFSTIFWETKRSDFAVMITHHVMTVALLVGSYLMNFTRIGALVLLVHDAADVFLEIAKSFNYLDLEYASQAAFVGFVSVWTYCRVYYYPSHIWWTIAFDTPQTFDVEDKLYYQYRFFNFLIGALFVMHLYWTYLIIQMLRRLLLGNFKDVREKDE